MLLALEANRLGFLPGPASGPGRFIGLAFSLGFGGWAFAPISKPYQLQIYLYLYIFNILMIHHFITN